MSKINLLEPEGFAEFWTIWRPYRRQSDGRGKAREPYRNRIIEGVEPHELIQGAEWYFKTLPEKDRPWIPLASTWLNGECYADYYDDKIAYELRLKNKPTANIIKMQPAGQTKFLKDFNAEKTAMPLQLEVLTE